VKQLIAILVLTLAMNALVGCASRNKGDVPTDSAVTDVTAPAPSAGYTPAPQPVAQPVTYDTMPAGTTSGSAYATAGGAGAGAYTVKRGDTLYSIARTRYGDGKQWQKIVAANPGLRPEGLKVGQTINIP
jgi:nucleoid-associated protein YgaU